MNKDEQIRGTPPTLWPKARPKGSVKPHYQWRIDVLAGQIEKLSWMLELMDEEPAINLEGAEYQWQLTHQRIG